MTAIGGGTRAANLSRWYDRMERAAALLGRRTDDPPTLAELAAAAGVSPFHFHRVWRGLTGETVGATVARLRAETAQMLLARKDASVTNVAMDMGYATPQSFARAFRARTGLTPSAAKAGAAPRGQASAPEPHVMLVTRAPAQVVALRREGGAYVALNELFQRVWDWADGAGVLGGLRGLHGIPYDDPASVGEAALRYDACLDLGAVAPPPSPFRLVALPDGPHALLCHRGSYDALEALDQWLVGSWLPASGHDPADAPLHHHFHNDPDTTPEPELLTDILLPLAPAPQP